MQPAVLQSLYGLRPDKARRCAGPMATALQLAQCTSHDRAAAFLAQVGHESGRLVYTREIWGPTPQQQRYEPKTTLSAKLGNVFRGDGHRYLGRGWLQTTGRVNYALTTVKLRELLGASVPDFEANPALLEQEEWAALSAALFWRAKNLNRWIDAGDFAELTRRINGGYNGLADRQLLFTRALMLPLEPAVELRLTTNPSNDARWRAAA